MTKILLILISLTLLPGLAFAKDKDSTLERAIKDEIFDDGKQKGKGRPDNPGQHGRDNAAQKQAIDLQGAIDFSAEFGQTLHITRLGCSLD